MNFCKILISLWHFFLLLHTLSASASTINLRAQENSASFKLKIKYLESVVNQYLSHCYQVTMYNDRLKVTQFGTSILPAIDINIVSPSSMTMHEEWNKQRKMRHPIRFQDQCIVYVVLMSTKLANEQMTRMQRLFLYPFHQIQAQQSYIFVVEYNGVTQTQGNKESSDNSMVFSGEKVLMDPGLKNYQHKTWIEVQSSEAVNKVLVNTFCYFCNDGQQGIIKYEEDIPKGPDGDMLNKIFPPVTSNFYGRKLRVTAAMALPFVGILPAGATGKKQKQKWKIEGMQGVILKGLATTLNFTISLENTSGGLTGSMLPNGSWTGTMREILNDKADIGLNVGINSQRYYYTDFTVSAYYGFLVLVSTKPSPIFEWKAIFYPFQLRTWLAISMTSLVNIIAFKFFLNFTKTRVRTQTSKIMKVLTTARSAHTIGNRQIENSAYAINDNEPMRRRLQDHVMKKKVKQENYKKKDKKPSVSKICFMTISSLLEQGTPFNFATAQAKVYTFFWFLFCLVGTCAYKTSDYTWGLRSLGGLALLFITKSPIRYVRDIGDKMEIYTDKYSCIDKTFSKKFVCIVYLAYYDYMSAVRYWKLNHKFHVSSPVMPPVGSSWVLPKYSPVLSRLDKSIYLQFEMGLAGIYLDHYIKSMALKTRAAAQNEDLFDLNTQFQATSVPEKPLKFANLYAEFLIIFFGSIVATAILLLEIFSWKQQDQIVRESKEERLRNNGINEAPANLKDDKGYFFSVAITVGRFKRWKFLRNISYGLYLMKHQRPSDSNTTTCSRRSQLNNNNSNRAHFTYNTATF